MDQIFGQGSGVQPSPDSHRHLRDQPIVTLATNGPDGRPQLGRDKVMRDVVTFGEPGASPSTVAASKSGAASRSRRRWTVRRSRPSVGLLASLGHLRDTPGRGAATRRPSASATQRYEARALSLRDAARRISAEIFEIHAYEPRL